MEAKRFNSIMSPLNTLWAARVLGMEPNPGRGPDLIDTNKIVEVKFKLVHPTEYHHKCWRVLDYQMNYNQKTEHAFWGLGFYQLGFPIKFIRTTNPRRLEGNVTHRELYIVEWDWMEQFPFYEQNGKTKLSEWHNVIAFPKARSLPEIIRSYEVEKGLVHLTEGIDPNLFPELK